MATKVTQQTECPTADTDAPKSQGDEATVKVENNEELRRRRAAIACFL